jgi:hypothetical protein
MYLINDIEGVKTLGKSRKDIVFDIHSKYAYDSDTFLDDVFFGYESLADIGGRVIKKVVEGIDFIDYEKYEEICEKGFSLNIETDFETDYAKSILGFRYLPKEAFGIVKAQYGDLMFEYNKLKTLFKEQSQTLYQRANQIKQAKGNYKSKIKLAINEGRDYTSDYDERYALIIAQDIIHVEIDKLEYSLSFIEEILNKLTNTELKRFAIQACIQHRFDDEDTLQYKIEQVFNYYKEMIEITNNHLKPRDFDLASVIVKTTKIYDKAFDKLQLSSYKHYNSSIPEQLIEEERSKVEVVRSFFATNDIKSDEVQDYIKNNSIVSNLRRAIIETYCIKDRSPIIDALELFEYGKYELFINIILVQFEGLLDDIILGLDLSNEKKFSNLRDKVTLLFADNTFEYYKYLFFDLNAMRNQIAHGNESEFYYLPTKEIYKENMVQNITKGAMKKQPYEIVACSLLFDLQAILHALVDKTEEKRIIKFIKWQYNLICKGEVTSEKLSGFIESKNFKEEFNWIINPRYNKLYEFYDGIIVEFKITEVIQKMREVMLSEEVWKLATTRYSKEDSSFFEDKQHTIQKSLNIVTMLKYQGFEEEQVKIRQVRKNFNKLMNTF